ncbi:MAG: hypothetical protein ABJL55_21935 [Roseibium sp.]
MQRVIIATLIWVISGLSSAMASPDIDFPQAGVSYGGKVRSGPGMQYRQTGSLRDGDDIRIISGTGIMMNGYEWFQIEYRNGRSGFQWGGIMCSQKPYVTIFKTCPALQPYANDPAPQTGGVTPLPYSNVNGSNVVQVDFPAGKFKQAGWRQWHETDAQGRVRFNFQEQARDEWSVYMFDASRNVSIQLDLYRKKILYGQGNQPKTDLYDIVNASATGGHQQNQSPRPSQPVGANGYTVAQVLHPGGMFTNVGGGQWHEANPQRHVTYRFQEQARDEWSVYLFDNSRNVAIQLDLHRKKILIGVGNGPKADLYNITSSAAAH